MSRSLLYLSKMTSCQRRKQLRPTYTMPGPHVMTMTWLNDTHYSNVVPFLFLLFPFLSLDSCAGTNASPNDSLLEKTSDDDPLSTIVVWCDASFKLEQGGPPKLPKTDITSQIQIFWRGLVYGVLVVPKVRLIDDVTGTTIPSAVTIVARWQEPMEPRSALKVKGEAGIGTDAQGWSGCEFPCHLYEYPHCCCCTVCLATVNRL